MRVRKATEIEEEVGWFLDYLQGERGASPHTIAAYDRDLRQIVALLGAIGLAQWSDLDAVSTAKLRAGLGAKNLAPASVQRKIAALRSFLNFRCARLKRAQEDLPSLEGTKLAKRLPKALTEAEMSALLTSPDSSKPSGLRDRAMLELLYGGGLRVTELAELKMEHYMRDESLLRVFGKGGKTRMIPIPAATHEWLRKYVDEARPTFNARATSAIFLNRLAGPLSRSGIFRIIRAHAACAGIEKMIGPHTLRHTYAVHLVRAGADLRSVQELLGHASIATTEIYTHLDMEAVKEKYDEAHPRAKKRWA